MTDFSYKLTRLKREIQSQRADLIREKLEKNMMTFQASISELQRLATSRTDFTVNNNDSVNFLSLRMDNPVCKFSGFIQSSSDRDDVNSDEVLFESTAKLPPVEKMPPYTTWIFLDRNQRMADDQSLAGRRRIYYDRHGGEALICSDSEEELGEPEAREHEFSEGEDRILRVAFLEYGAGDEVIDTLTKFVGGTSLEIQERWNLLREKDELIGKEKVKYSKEEGFEDIILLDKSLDAALDSFDNLFCRRCLVFDCRLHGCSQNLIYPNEKQAYASEPEEERKPCGSQCYLQWDAMDHLPKNSKVDLLDESQSKVVEDKYIEQENYLEVKGKLQVQDLVPDDMPSSSCNKLKLGVPYAVDNSEKLGGELPDSGESSSDNKISVPAADSEQAQQTCRAELNVLVCVPGNKAAGSFRDEGNDIAELSVQQAGNPCVKEHAYIQNEWKQFEKDLYLKGIEIFGRNSCCISRNLLSGLKTCREVYGYMFGDGVVFPRGSLAMLSSFLKVGGKTDMDNMDPEMLMKSRLCRKRGRTKKMKSSWKSAGHPSLWRRVIDGKDQPSKHYVPCGCQNSCGKQCSCLQNGTCCEKYCGCAKSCKNVFRGCHCAKSQCKSRQCPCFAAGRECDPDVCRNCWVSCGDGSLGEPPKQGDGQCGNMKLLLRQRQRVLLAMSDVAGWGAFLKNSVNKNEYLGEYTGELISHREADRRGKIYDRANSSFLFDLNDQYVLDAYRKGDKLKFANHSANPNCYAKVMSVAGDHRVGIFAKEYIEAGEELFYDYRYGPNEAPSWARKPEGSKREGSPAPQGRAKKHQSG